jgi:DNA uptake protein ComE-like DNA-binding protein
MQRRQWSTHNNGYALVIVMGLLAILGIMALSLGAAARVDLAQTRRFQDEIAAELLSKAGVEWTMSYLNALARDGTMWQAPWTDPAARFRGRALGPGFFDIQHNASDGMLHNGPQDEEARVNLNSAPLALLAALPGIGPELAEQLVASRQQAPWHAPEEIVQQGFVTPSVWLGAEGRAGLSAYVTVWGSGKINVNTASAVVLAAVPGLTPPMVEALMRHRRGVDNQEATGDDQHFRTLEALATVPEIGTAGLERLGTVLTVTPSAFRLVTTGRVLSGTRQASVHRRMVVLEHSAQATALRYWRQLD